MPLLAHIIIFALWHTGIMSDLFSETVVQLSGGIGGPAKSVPDPYDAASLHMFIREAFPGSVLLEEHEVSMTNHRITIIYNVMQPLVPLLIGFCIIPAS